MFLISLRIGVRYIIFRDEISKSLYQKGTFHRGWSDGIEMSVWCEPSWPQARARRKGDIVLIVPFLPAKGNLPLNPLGLRSLLLLEKQS